MMSCGLRIFYSDYDMITTEAAILGSLYTALKNAWEGMRY